MPHDVDYAGKSGAFVSNATRKVARSKAGARTREHVYSYDRESAYPVVDKVESGALEREMSTTTNVELFPYSAVMDCSRAAYSKGWSRGFLLGICVGGAVALLTYAITFATSVLP